MGGSFLVNTVELNTGIFLTVNLIFPKSKNISGPIESDLCKFTCIMKGMKQHGGYAKLYYIISTLPACGHKYLTVTREWATGGYLQTSDCWINAISGTLLQTCMPILESGM